MHFPRMSEKNDGLNFNRGLNFMFPRNDAVRNTPFDLIFGTDRLLHARCGGGGGGTGGKAGFGGVRASGRYNVLRGLILGGQFWNAQNVKGVEI